MKTGGEGQAGQVTWCEEGASRSAEICWVEEEKKKGRPQRSGRKLIEVISYRDLWARSVVPHAPGCLVLRQNSEFEN